MTAPYSLTMALRYLHARIAARLVPGPFSTWFLDAVARISLASSSGDLGGSLPSACVARGVPLTGISPAINCLATCHAWSVLGQWSGIVTFPVPALRVWPRYGHLRGILDGYQGRQPNFHKWVRPVYEQGALPTLSLLPGEVSIRVLPGDKMHQAMEIEPGFMRPVILHGFGTNAKRRLSASLTDLAQHRWLPIRGNSSSPRKNHQSSVQAPWLRCTLTSATLPKGDKKTKDKTDKATTYRPMYRQGTNKEGRPKEIDEATRLLEKDCSKATRSRHPATANR